MRDVQVARISFATLSVLGLLLSTATAIYQQTAPPPLDFNFGYRWKSAESDLIVATRL